MAGARTIHRNLGVLALLVLGAAVLAGCGSGPTGARPAATVGDVEISQQQVQDLVEDQIQFVKLSRAAAKAKAKASPDDAELAAAAQQADQETESVLADYEGTGSADSYGTTGAAQVLSTLIDIEVSRQALESAGGKVDEQDLDSVRTSIEESLTQQGLKSVKPFEGLLELEVERQALQTALKATMTDAAKEREQQVRDAYEQGLAGQTQLCVNILVTQDEAAGRAAVDRINGGEDFLAVANEVSLDKTTLTEGSEQCVAKASLANVFGDAVATAQAGQVLGPSDGQGSWLTVRVVSEKTPTFEESRAAIESAIDQAGTPNPVDTAVQAAQAKAAKKADIVVNPRFGTWNSRTLRVEPPTDPAAALSTTVPATVAADPTGN